MSFRDDHDAALMRADAAVRERDLLAAENQRLAAELAEAREWLGGPSKRAFLVGGLVVAAIALAGGGVLLGRATVDIPAPATVRVREPKLPTVAGVVVADGTLVGHWIMTATRCATRSDGVELTNVGGAGRSIWLANDQVELETPTGTVFLTRKQCISKLAAVVARTDDMLGGYVELDCAWDDNRLHGRIDFQHCR